MFQLNAFAAQFSPGKPRTCRGGNEAEPAEPSPDTRSVRVHRRTRGYCAVARLAAVNQLHVSPKGLHTRMLPTAAGRQPCVCMYVYVYVYAYMHVYVCVYVHVCLYVC
jgi:hypothetical protein